MKKTYFPLINKVREKKPLVHHITNYVTANDCANITLAIGASPIMADAVEEAADIARSAAAAVLNIGTLNKDTAASMLAAGKAANQADIPVIFDPAGIGATPFRNQTTAHLLDEIKISVLCGNISEIRFLTGTTAATRGVDAAENDKMSVDEAIKIAGVLAARLDCVVAITGATDVVSDGKTVVAIKNGHPMLGRLTGTGCMCSSLIGAFCGAAPDAPLEAAAGALLAMGIAGEIAMEKQPGNGSFRTALHDAISRMDEDTLTKRAKLHEARYRL